MSAAGAHARGIPAVQEAAAAGAPAGRAGTDTDARAGAAGGQSQLARAWQEFHAQRSARWALYVLGVVVGSCVLLPFVWPWEATEIDFTLLRAAPPSLEHPLGTDSIGRDQLARLLAAGRISLAVGFLVAALSVCIGAAVGVVAGYFGGKLDAALMWVVTVLMTIPSLPLLIAVSVLVASPDSHFGGIVRQLPEQWRIVIVMATLGWMGISRVARSQVLSLRRQEYVEAAAALGASHGRRMAVHVLPNLIPIMVVFGTFGVSGAIMGESFLSFLGVGVNPPTATWGNMIAGASDVATVVNEWWLIWTPSAAILATVLAINFVGEGLRSAVDPRAQ